MRKDVLFIILTIIFILLILHFDKRCSSLEFQVEHMQNMVGSLNVIVNSKSTGFDKAMISK